MKKYLLLPFVAIAAMLCSCSNNDDFSDAVFVTGTLSSPNVKFLVDGQSSMGITVTSSCKAGDDMKIVLKPAPELLDAYNTKMGRNYQVPPTDAYTIENGNVVIKSGTNQSTQMKLTCDGDKLAEGVAYCLPVTIESAEGGLKVLETSRTAYVMFTKVIDIKVANLGGQGGFDIKKFWLSENENTPVLAMNQMTLEMKVLPVAFGTNPRSASGISSLCGCEENFLFRFGDGAGQPTNKLQFVKGSIGQAQHPDKKDHYESWVEKMFDTGHWLHFAAVYDGSYVRVYLDGEQIFFAETKNGGTVNLAMAYDGHSWNDGFSIGRSAGYARYFNGYISECRVWNVARTTEQLENGICYVDPTSEGLLAYWRFNGEVQDDGTVRDETGHGYDATPFGTVKYVDKQKCPY